MSNHSYTKVIIMQQLIAQTPIGICEVPDLRSYFLVEHYEGRVFRCASYKNTIIEEIANIDTGGKTLKNKAGSGGLIIEKLKELTGEFIKGIRYDEPVPIIVNWNGI